MIEVINFYFITDREQNQELSTIRCRKHGSKKMVIPMLYGTTKFSIIIVEPLNSTYNLHLLAATNMFEPW